MKDIETHVRATGMKLNASKSKLLVINPSHNSQAVPLISLEPGDPVLCVAELRILGLVFDEKLS